MSDLDFIIAFESGECTEDQIIEGFQSLVNSGLVWSLQGLYGRTAQAMLDAGLIQPKQENL